MRGGDHLRGRRDTRNAQEILGGTGLIPGTALGLTLLVDGGGEPLGDIRRAPGRVTRGRERMHEGALGLREIGLS